MTNVVYSKTKHKINRLGFGAWQLGNGLWGDMSIDLYDQQIKNNP